jgi:hypothetical protein
VADLPDGWLLVYKEKGEIEEMEALAAFGPAVASFASESVMYSETRGYADGQEQWRIVYDADGEEGPRGLEVGGTPPPRFESILQEAKATQAKHRDADYIFDVPGEMAASVCGFMIGLTEPDDLRFTNLRKARSGRSPATQPQPKSGSFFARLFGRG